ncbi:hypothetical protein ACIXNL_14215 [Bacteroides fragilis]
MTSTKRGKGVVTFDAVDRNAPSGTRCYGYDMKYVIKELRENID